MGMGVFYYGAFQTRTIPKYLESLLYQSSVKKTIQGYLPFNNIWSFSNVSDTTF